MTAEEGMRLAQHQRPGVRIVMGATQAREDRIEPVWEAPWWRLNRLGVSPLDALELKHR